MQQCLTSQRQAGIAIQHMEMALFEERGIVPRQDIVIVGPSELLPIDATWFARCRYRDYYAAYFGSAERTLEQGFGYCLIRGQELLSEAFAADAALGMIEIGTITSESSRRRRYAAVTCAQLIRECEARGYRTYWNCAKDNLASAELARRLGH